MIPQSPQSLAPMAHLAFPRQLCLAKRTSKRRVMKQRIIPKPMRAPGLLQQHPLHYASKTARHFTLMRQGNHANKSGRPVQCARHPFQHQPVIVRIIGMLPREPRRIYPRGAAQCVHLQPRIIREHRVAAEPGIVNRLQGRVLLERRARLFRRRNPVDIRQLPYIVVCLQGRSKFLDLGRVGRRAIQNWLHAAYDKPTCLAWRLKQQEV